MKEKKESKAMNQQNETPKQMDESVYPVEEIAENATKIFGAAARPECVNAAFKMAGRDTAPIKEAKKIILDFLKREV